MLTRLEIERFRSLAHVAVDLSPLTVLVGPNGAGKSSILDALRPRLAVRVEDIWRQVVSSKVGRTVVRDGESRRSATAANQAFSDTWRYQRLELEPGTMRASNVVAPATELAEDGANLTNVVEGLGRRRQEELSRRFCELVPLFSDIDVLPSPRTEGEKRIVFFDRWNPSLRYSPDEVSDGSILMLAFLTLSLVDSPPDVLVIEGPEKSLHPYLLGQVIEILRAMTEGKLGKQPTQVVIATHSAALLDFVRPEEVRFVTRDLTTGATVVRAAPTETVEFQQAWEAYDESLGELWLSGGLGGVPAPAEPG